VYLIDHTTKEVNGEGLVHGGAPVSYADIAEVLGCSVRSIQTWKKKLETAKYIRTARTNHQGSVRWWVKNIKKFQIATANVASATQGATARVASSTARVASSTANVADPRETTTETTAEITIDRPSLAGSPEFLKNGAELGSSKEGATATIASATQTLMEKFNPLAVWAQSTYSS
jgi:hypothetical protein